MKSQKLSILLLSFFGTGFSPKAPGTVGSIATIPLMLILSKTSMSIYKLIVGIVLLTVVSGVITDKIQKERNEFDPGWIVIDEVIGMLITWLVIYPRLSMKDIIVILVLFRFFDIVKIWPASYFDKKVKSGFGTILDDVVSAFYAGFVLYLITFFNLLA